MKAILKIMGVCSTLIVSCPKKEMSIAVLVSVDLELGILDSTNLTFCVSLIRIKNVVISK